MVTSLHSYGEDRRNRVNWTTVGWGIIFLLLVVQAGIIYFTYFNPTRSSSWVSSPTLYSSSARTPFTATRHTAGVSTNDSGPLVTGGHLKHNTTAPLNNTLSQGVADKRLSTGRHPSSVVPSSADKRPSTEPLSRSSDVVAAPYFNPSGPTWQRGSFCESFVEKTFQTPLPVCGTKMLREHSIKCFYNVKSTHMAYCILEDAAMSGPRKLGSSSDITLLTGGGKSCPTISLSGLHKTTEGGDSVRKLVDGITARKPQSDSVCQEWIDKPAFLYSGDQNVHIYFRMNAYFNLHKAIEREGVAPGEFVIIRHRSKSDYLFPEWERKLFPEMIHVDELPNKTICFRKLVLVPGGFTCIIFRCKMESNVRGPCFNCKGRGLYGNYLYGFRHRVISSCGLQDEKHHVGNRITIVSRTPYQRWKSDNPKKFQRVLGNEDALVKALRQNFPKTNVTVAHMEALDICTQISLAHDADVVMGVHGAGLVHLWWLQEDALAVELNPTFQTGNPSFKMLSTLAGRNYLSITATGSQHLVTVKVDSVIQQLKSHTHLS